MIKMGNKLFSKLPIGYQLWDVARDKKQAFSLAMSNPLEHKAIVLKTGKHGDVFPYTIAIRKSGFYKGKLIHF